jgi:hypothetical protein
VIGILLGLIISWVIAPVKYVDTTPASLRTDFKDQFRIQISSAFFATNNLQRAKARLDLLGDPDPIQDLTNQAQNLLDIGDPTNTAIKLAYLIDALKQNVDVFVDVFNETTSIISTAESSTTPSLTETKLPTTGTPSKQPEKPTSPTLRPTNTPSPTPGSPFILKTNQVICNNPQTTLLLQVEVTNSAGQPIPGAEIVISWSGGEEHFFTGLKPELGDGYADYLMTPDVVYSIQLAKGGAVVSNLTAPPCSSDPSVTVWGSLKLVFQQP